MPPWSSHTTSDGAGTLRPVKDWAGLIKAEPATPTSEEDACQWCVCMVWCLVYEADER